MKHFFIILFFVARVGFAEVRANAMEYFSSKAPERLLEQEAEIQLLTWNILGLPNEQVAVRPWEERIDRIAERILSIDAEIVLLQECFEPGLSLGLKDRLEKVYPHIYLHLKDDEVPLPSGLALFSKLPIANFQFFPHPNLLDTERNSRMGTIEFLLLDAFRLPIAHIAASHFQGSSNCEWRVGLTEEGERLSYAEVREQQANRILSLSSPCKIPHYVCGDLNVDRRSREYDHSSLNEENCKHLMNAMDWKMKMQGTNTNFWKHEKGIAKLYPELTKQQALELALQYERFYVEKLKPALINGVSNKPLSHFDPSYFSQMENELNLHSEDQRTWEYFKMAATEAVAKEKELWKMNQNQGDAPLVTIGKVIEVRALPIEESLDYVLGLGELSIISKIEILEGYDHSSIENTLSDHHFLLAKIRVARERSL